MGVAKSLRKADHLNPLGQGLSQIGAFLEENRKKREQQEFAQGIVRLYDKWKAGQESAQQKETLLKEGGKVTNIFSPENMTGKNLAGEKPTGMNLSISDRGQENTLPAPTMIPETQTRQTSPEEQYSKAQNNLNDFSKELAPMLMGPNVTAEQMDKANVLNNLARNQTETLRPKETTYFDLNKGQRKYRMNTAIGKPEEIAFNPGEESSSKDGKKDFKVSEDGFYMYWDDMANGKGDWVKTSQKAPKDKGEQSTAWARLFYEMTKDKEEGANKKKESQGKYNSIMGSKFLTTEELLDQKIITSDDPQAKKYGGAYVVRDDKNYQNYKVLYTDKELEDYAKNQVSETPNKWERTDPAGIKDKEKDPLGIR